MFQITKNSAAIRVTQSSAGLRTSIDARDTIDDVTTTVILSTTPASPSAEIESTTVRVASDQVASGRIGPRGVQGIQGVSGLDVISLEAGEELPLGCVVYVNDNKFYKASNNAHPNPIGLALSAVAQGFSTFLRADGPFTNPDWVLVPNTPYYLGVDGLLTAVAPATGYIVRIGTAVSTTTLFISIQEPILLS